LPPSGEEWSAIFHSVNASGTVLSTGIHFIITSYELDDPNVVLVAYDPGSIPNYWFPTYVSGSGDDESVYYMQNTASLLALDYDGVTLSAATFTSSVNQVPFTLITAKQIEMDVGA
jgi:hypothetical protein